jgi:hypothetical protein
LLLLLLLLLRCLREEDLVVVDNDMGEWLRKVTTPFKRMWGAVHTVVLLRLHPHKRGTDFLYFDFTSFLLSCGCLVCVLNDLIYFLFCVRETEI